MLATKWGENSRLGRTFVDLLETASYILGRPLNSDIRGKMET